MNTIDYVVPMVFPDDEEWRKGFNSVGSMYTDGHVRWRSWGTEHQLIRLVKKNMPFVRNIIILLAGESQVRPWMLSEGVRIVFHRDFIPLRYLPCFNSRTMEMFLHKIPGLSDDFVYGNDDMFPVSTLDESDFFIDGVPCIHMNEKVFPENPNNFQMACMKGLNFVAEEFGKRFTDIWYKNGHSIAPIKKKTCLHMWERGNRILASITRFREPCNFNQYIYSWWQYFSGEYADKLPEHKYVSVKKTVDEVRAALLEENGIVCVNDNESVVDYKKYAKVTREALEVRLAE